MKIIFILPAVGKKEGQSYIASWQMQPLTIAVLAGLTPPEHEVAFYDDRLEEIPYDEPADLVGISAETYTAKRAYEISRRFRERGTPVVMGGFHPTLIPEEAALHADAVVIGEAEGIWHKVLEDARGKKLQKFYKSEKRPPLAGVMPRRDIFKGKKYLPLALVEASRGCVRSCGFCSIGAFYKSTHNYKPVEDLIREVERVPEKNIFFTDDNLTDNSAVSKKLFNALIPLNKKWISQSSIKVAEDEALLKLMKKSGCMGLLIGFESLNSDNLRQMGKNWVNEKENELYIKKIRAHGIKIYGTFILGYDCDDEKGIEENLKFALKQKFFLAAFNHLIPFPGTPLYEHLKSRDRFIYEKWWLDKNYRYGDVSFMPKLMPADELARNCVYARQKFYGFASILNRMFDFKANCKGLDFMFFLTLNFLLRKEVTQKVGLTLGKDSIGEKINEPVCV